MVVEKVLQVLDRGLKQRTTMNGIIIDEMGEALSTAIDTLNLVRELFPHRIAARKPTGFSRGRNGGSLPS